MKFSEFQHILSEERLQRYLLACDNNTRKTMRLYRLNLNLSQEVFTLLSCFEVAVRNAIDRILRENLGQDWLRDAIFARRQPEIGTAYILNAYQTLHKLFLWMGIDSHSLLYGLDHVQQVCSKINNLKE